MHPRSTAFQTNDLREGSLEFFVAATVMSSSSTCGCVHRAMVLSKFPWIAAVAHMSCEGGLICGDMSVESRAHPINELDLSKLLERFRKIGDELGERVPMRSDALDRDL